MFVSAQSKLGVTGSTTAIARIGPQPSVYGNAIYQCERLLSIKADHPPNIITLFRTILIEFHLMLYDGQEIVS